MSSVIITLCTWGGINLELVIILAVGVLLGGLCNLCISRIPKGEAMLPPSHSSRVRQSVRYLIVTVLITMIFLLIYNRYGVSFQGLAYIILTTGLVITAFIDLDYRIIPNSINYFLGIAGIFFVFIGWTVSLKNGVLGFSIGGGVLYIIGILSIWILKKEGMGGGDIKQAAVCGLYMGAGKTVCSLLITSYISFIIILILFVAGKLRKGQYIPYGPFLSAGVIIVILFYQDIIDTYYRLVLG